MNKIKWINEQGYIELIAQENGIEVSYFDFKSKIKSKIITKKNPVLTINQLKQTISSELKDNLETTYNGPDAFILEFEKNIIYHHPSKSHSPKIISFIKSLKSFKNSCIFPTKSLEKYFLEELFRNTEND